MIVTLEENVRSGGFGEKILDIVNNEKLLYPGIGTECLIISLPDEFIEHGDCRILKEKAGIDADSVTEKILNVL